MLIWSRRYSPQLHCWCELTSRLLEHPIWSKGCVSWFDENHFQPEALKHIYLEHILLELVLSHNEIKFLRYIPQTRTFPIIMVNSVSKFVFKCDYTGPLRPFQVNVWTLISSHLYSLILFNTNIQVMHCISVAVVFLLAQ